MKEGHLLLPSDYQRVSGRDDLPFSSSDTGVMILHLHTTASDGLLTPQEIDERAYRAGIDVIAFTDHDTLSGHNLVNGSGKVHKIPCEEVTTAENYHIGAILRDEVTIPYWLPLSETIQRINLVGHVFVPHVEMDSNSLSWEQIAKQNASPNPLDHIQLVETTNGADLKKTAKVKSNKAWGMVFKHSGSSERAREKAKSKKAQLRVEEIGAPDAHFKNDLFDVVMVFPRDLDPLEAMLGGDVAVFEKVRQAKVTLVEFVIQRRRANRLAERRKKFELV